MLRLCFVAILTIAAPTFSFGAMITTIFGTGVSSNGTLLVQGTSDSHYQITSAPTGSGYGPNAFVTVNNGYPFSGPQPWIAQGPNSQWIQPASGTADGIVFGNVTYRTTFDLPTGQLFGTFISFKVATDNQLVDLFFNGNPTGITHNSFTSYSSTKTINSGFIAGLNTIDFVVFNETASSFGSPNPAGLRVEILDSDIGVAIPEPSSSLLILCASMATVLRSRRTA